MYVQILLDPPEWLEVMDVTNGNPLQDATI